MVVIGDFSIGKSTLLRRFTSHDVFIPQLFSPPDYVQRLSEINEKIIKMIIFDTIGREFNLNSLSNLLRRANGIVLAYDISNRESFGHLEYWKTLCDQNSLDHTAYVLVGLKKDLSEKREVRKEEGESLAKSFQIPFFEASSYDNENVEIVFVTLAQNILSNPLFQKHTEPIISPHKKCL